MINEYLQANGFVHWSHPLEWVLASDSPAWRPRINLKVNLLCDGKSVELAHGSAALPGTCGYHELLVPIARRVLSRAEDMSLSFLHELPECDTSAADADACGHIKISLSILERSESD